MKQLIKFAASFLITVLIFASCNKQKDLQQQNNKPPVANAGSDKTIILPTDSTQLTGIGTDVDGTIVKFEWTKFSGPAQYRFGNSTDATTTVKDLVEGAYLFELKVTDNGGLSATDTVIVTVFNSANNPCNGCWDY